MRAALNEMSSQRPKILQKVLNRPGLISTLFFVAGLYYAYVIFGGDGSFEAERTRISEHSLLPGDAPTAFDRVGFVEKTVNELTESQKIRSRHESICFLLVSSGLPCYMQNWKTKVAIKNATGTNIYTVVNAGRATGSESILFAVDSKNLKQAAVLIGFAKFATEQVYWARDIWFVFVDGYALGFDAFLSSYHMVSAPGVEGASIYVPGGPIIGAIVLDKSIGKTPNTVEVRLNYMNGQLPNLDLFNSAVRIAEVRCGLGTVIYGVSAQQSQQNHLLTPLRAVYTQAFVTLDGMHSVLGKYGVQGLTVAPSRSSGRLLEQSAYLIEGLARSLNNIPERFHQSYFMYILPTIYNFISIAYYMPMMITVMPLLICAYSEWVVMPSFLVPSNLLVFHAYGAFVWLASSHLAATSAFNAIHIIGALCVPVGLLIPLKQASVRNLRFLLVLEASLALMALSLLNFSLAFAVSILSVPQLFALSRNNTSGPKAFARTVGATCAHPLGLFVIFIIYCRPLLEFSKAPPVVSMQLLTNCIQRLLEEQLLYGSWLFGLMCLIGIPIWNGLIAITSTPAKDLSEAYGIEEQKNEKKLKDD